MKTEIYCSMKYWHLMPVHVCVQKQVGQEWGGGDWEIRQRAHTQDPQIQTPVWRCPWGRGGAEAGCRWAKGREIGASVIVSTIKWEIENICYSFLKMTFFLLLKFVKPLVKYHSTFMAYISKMNSEILWRLWNDGFQKYRVTYLA